MKHILLSILVICLLAGQASADFTPTTEDLLFFSDVSWSMESGRNWLEVTDDLATYQAGDDNVSMINEVGFSGFLYDTASEKWVQIGGFYTGDLSGEEAYSLSFANDNDDYWDVKLYVTTGGDNGGTWETGWVTIAKDAVATLTLDFSDLGVMNLDDVQDLGFFIGSNHNDMFHVSVSPVPVPAAVVIGILGLGVAGLKLRKFV